MSKAIAPGFGSEIWGKETGIGKDSEVLRTVLQKAHDHATEPLSLGWKRQLYDLAMEIGSECSAPGWDGYRGAQIQTKAVIQTLKLISQLPDSSPRPELVPSPEGHISFEWHGSKGRVLSVSPKKELLIWASVLGPDDTAYGRSPARKCWPESILTILRDYFW